jgi:hypothetical protein
MDSEYETASVYAICSRFGWWAIAVLSDPKKDAHAGTVGTE